MRHLCHTASILSETGGAAAELELVKVEPGDVASCQEASLSPAWCLRTIVTLQASQLLLPTKLVNKALSFFILKTYIKRVNDALDDTVGTGVHEGDARLTKKPSVRGGAGEDDERVARASHRPVCSIPVWDYSRSVCIDSYNK